MTLIFLPNPETKIAVIQPYLLARRETPITRRQRDNQKTKRQYHLRRSDSQMEKERERKRKKDRNATKKEGRNKFKKNEREKMNLRKLEKVEK